MIVNTLSYFCSSECAMPQPGGEVVRVSRVTDDVARVYITAARRPENYAMRNVSTGRDVPLYQGEWLICWASSYELCRGGEGVLRIESTREQTIRALTR